MGNWKTAAELNNDYYEIFHSKTGYNFELIGTEKGAGNVTSTKEYIFNHRIFESGIHYYSLNSVDFNGDINDNGTISVQVNNDEIRFNKHTQTLHFPNKGEYHVYSSSGQLVLKVRNQAQMSFLKKGFFLVYNAKSGVVTKVIIQ